jgi:hypothetical protein
MKNISVKVSIVVADRPKAYTVLPTALCPIWNSSYREASSIHRLALCAVPHFEQ